MTTSDDEREVLARVPRRLVGRELLDVRYVDVGPSDGQPSWHANGFHALDYGVELDMDGPLETWSVIWKMAGEVEALLVYDGPLIGQELQPDGDYGRWDVAVEQPWAAIVGQSITSAEFIEWEDYGTASAPVALRLTFEQTEVVLALGAANAAGEFVPSADDVAVFASLELARERGAIRR